MTNVYYQSRFVSNRKPPPVATGSEIVFQKAVIPLSQAFVPSGPGSQSGGTAAAVIAGDIIEALVLPARHVLVPDSITLSSDILDTNTTTPLLTWNVGLMSGIPGVVDLTRTVGTELFSASNVSQYNGTNKWGVAFPSATNAGYINLFPLDYDKSIGIKAAAGAATGVTSLTGLTNNRGIWQPNTLYAAGDYITLPTGIRAKCTTQGTSSGALPSDIPPALGTTPYNNTVTDGSVTWTIADPSITLTIGYGMAG